MASVALAIFFVFLGCSSNVFFLEHLINIDSTRKIINSYYSETFFARIVNIKILNLSVYIYAWKSGHLITFCQFLFISFFTYLFHFSFKNGVVSMVLNNELGIPLFRHIKIVALFVSVSVINNWAFSFNIPISLHTVFRY